MRTLLISAILLLFSSHHLRAQISLQAYRDSVYLASTEMMNAEQEIEKAASAVAKERTEFLPSLSAEAMFSNSFRRDDGNKLWGFSVVPQLRQTLYAGGGVRAAFRRAQSDYEATKYDAQSVRLLQRFEADYAYWQVSATELYMAATDRYVEIIRSLYRIVQERYSEGYVAKSDLLQVEARLSDAEYSQIAVRNNYEKALHLFNNLLGVHEPSPVILSQSITDTIPMPRRIAFADIVGRRPDVLSAERKITSAKYGVQAVRAAYNPNLYAGVSGSWQTFSPNMSGRTFWDGAVTLGLSVPIFHFGSRRHSVAQAKAEERIQYNLWEQVRDDIEQEEADGWSALSSSYSQMQSSLKNLEIASENLSISTYSYREGQATVLDVLQAQISWIQIYTNAITARFNYAVAVSAYMRITAAD